jgi:hypothetical protein
LDASAPVDGDESGPSWLVSYQSLRVFVDAKTDATHVQAKQPIDDAPAEWYEVNKRLRTMAPKFGTPSGGI